MTYPNPTPIFHITSIENLEQILEVGELCSKNLLAAKDISYCNVAHESIQGQRSNVVIAKGPRETLHDYVPFYFAPRSPMLYAINRGIVQGCTSTQEDMLHLVTYAQTVDAAQLPYVFTNGHAIMQPLEVFDSIADIDKVDWEILLEPPLIGGYAQYWQTKHNPAKPKWLDRKRLRQAEFLVHCCLPWQLILRIGTMNESVAVRTRQILAKFGLDTPVEVMRDWYH